MKDEIKEILDNLIRYRYSDYECKQPEDCLTIEDVWLLLDYITNLQEERNKMACLVNELQEDKEDLQEENKRLKEENKHIFANVNDDQLLRSNAMNYAEAQDYKTRNEKASTYIEHYLIGNIAKAENCQRSLKYLLNILQGKSDE